MQNTCICLNAIKIRKMEKKKAAKCAKCGKKAVKYGIRKNKLQVIQRYKCSQCGAIFTLQQTKNKTYPINIILKAVSAYNLGYNLSQTQEKMEKSQKMKIPISTISSWINDCKEICTFARIRKDAIKQFSPKNIISKKPLSHIQPYTFKYHKAKLEILTRQNSQFAGLKTYFEKISSKEFPHHIFTYNKNNSQNG